MKALEIFIQVIPLKLIASIMNLSHIKVYNSLYSGFVGDRCEQVILNPCDAGPCPAGASCVRQGLFDYECNCPSGFIGSQCTTRKLRFLGYILFVLDLAFCRYYTTREKRNHTKLFTIIAKWADRTGQHH